MMGLFAEELPLNQRFDLGPYQFTIDNMQAYARKFDPVGFHVDEAAGRASPYGAMTAAGLHVASAWMACFVETTSKARAALALEGKVLPDVGPSPGFKNMKWLRPVFAGDILSFFTTAQAMRPLSSRPGWAMVSGYNEGVDQTGAVVFSFESAVLTACKN